MIKRLMAEYSEYTKNPSENFFLKPVVPNSFDLWEGLLNGPIGTPYEGFAWKISLDTSSRKGKVYPSYPPVVKFITNIKHINVNGGNICLDILEDPSSGSSSQNQWSPVLRLSKIMFSLLDLIQNPNENSPYDGDLCKLFRQSPKNYEKNIRDHCNIHAIKIEKKEPEKKKNEEEDDQVNNTKKRKRTDSNDGEDDLKEFSLSELKKQKGIDLSID
jgi:ubiquitin-protein ligase